MHFLYILALVQPSYALLPATSYPKTVGRMCYAIMKAHTKRVKYNQLPNHRPGTLDMLSHHAKHRQAIPAWNHPISREGGLDTLSQHAVETNHRLGNQDMLA